MWQPARPRATGRERAGDGAVGTKGEVVMTCQPTRPGEYAYPLPRSRMNIRIHRECKIICAEKSFNGRGRVGWGPLDIRPGLFGVGPGLFGVGSGPFCADLWPPSGPISIQGAWRRLSCGASGLVRPVGWASCLPGWPIRGDFSAVAPKSLLDHEIRSGMPGFRRRLFVCRRLFRDLGARNAENSPWNEKSPPRFRHLGRRFMIVERFPLPCRKVSMEIRCRSPPRRSAASGCQGSRVWPVVLLGGAWSNGSALSGPGRVCGPAVPLGGTGRPSVLTYATSSGGSLTSKSLRVLAPPSRVLGWPFRVLAVASRPSVALPIGIPARRCAT